MAGSTLPSGSGHQDPQKRKRLWNTKAPHDVSDTSAASPWRNRRGRRHHLGCRSRPKGFQHGLSTSGLQAWWLSCFAWLVDREGEASLSILFWKSFTRCVDSSLTLIKAIILTVPGWYNPHPRQVGGTILPLVANQLYALITIKAWTTSFHPWCVNCDDPCPFHKIASSSNTAFLIVPLTCQNLGQYCGNIMFVTFLTAYHHGLCVWQCCGNIMVVTFLTAYHHGLCVCVCVCAVCT